MKWILPLFADIPRPEKRMSIFLHTLLGLEAVIRPVMLIIIILQDEGKVPSDYLFYFLFLNVQFQWPLLKFPQITGIVVRILQPQPPYILSIGAQKTSSNVEV